MSEIIFVVEDDPESGFCARALGVSIFTEAETLEALREQIKDAVRCHFHGEAEQPSIIRMHYVRDEVLTP